jgi:hypothetical protein
VATLPQRTRQGLRVNTGWQISRLGQLNVEWKVLRWACACQASQQPSVQRQQYKGGIHEDAGVGNQYQLAVVLRAAPHEERGGCLPGPQHAQHRAHQRHYGPPAIGA